MVAIRELAVTGLRDPMWELYGETCGPSLRTLKNGRAVVDVEGDSEVDEEDAFLRAGLSARPSRRNATP